MNMSRPLFGITLVALALAACAPGTARLGAVEAAALATETDQAKAAPACPVTLPPAPAFSPPAPWPTAGPFESDFWYGSEGLWTSLNVDGVWDGLPYQEGMGYGQKLAWWRVGYNHRTEQQPALTVTGRRLAGDPNAMAETLAASRATNGFHQDLRDFMLVGVDFPSLGCWEITGEYGSERVSFVVLVEE